jgi:hypothetical protein
VLVVFEICSHFCACIRQDHGNPPILLPCIAGMIGVHCCAQPWIETGS